MLPSPIIIILPGYDEVSADGRWIGKKQVKTRPLRPCEPRRPLQPIPSFDRRALRERVTRILHENKLQRESLRAAAWARPQLCT